MALIKDKERIESIFFWKVGQFFGLLRSSLTQYFLFRKTVAELRALSNRELDDLGISRFMIAFIAHRVVYHKKN